MPDPRGRARDPDEDLYFTPDPLHALDIIWHHRWLIVIFTILAAAVSFFVSAKVPKRYTTTAKIRLESKIEVGNIRQLRTRQLDVLRRMPSIRRVLQSRDTLTRVLTALDEVDEQTTPYELEERVEEFRTQIIVRMDSEDLLAVALTDPSALRAYRGLQLVVDIAIAELQRPQRDALIATNEFLEGQVAHARARLDELEDQRRLMLGDDPDRLPAVADVNLDGYESVRGQIVETHSELMATRAELGAVRRGLSERDPAIDSLNANLSDAQVELARMQARYTPGHPVLAAAQARVRNLNTQLSLRLSKHHRRHANADDDRRGPSGQRAQRRQLTARVRGLEIELEALRSKANELLGKVQSTNEFARTVLQIERDFEVAKRSYALLLRKSQEARINREMEIYDEGRHVWLVQAPQLPTMPGGLPRSRIFMAGTAAGGGFGLGLGILLQFWRRRHRHIDSVIEDFEPDLMVLQLPHEKARRDG